MRKVLFQLAYNLLFLLGFAIAWPYYGWRLWKRGQLWRNFGQRLGWYSPEVRERIGGGVDVWVHAVSVGEVRLAAVLLKNLRDFLPGARIVLSTTTQTGQRVALRLEDERTIIVYNPVDFLWPVRAAFNAFRPRLLVLIEAEIWPNVVWCAKRRGIPIYLVNARLSDRTEARFRRFRSLVRGLLDQLDLVFAQDDKDIARLAGAGFPPERIFNMGSLKYDVADTPLANLEEIEAWWRNSGWPPHALVLLAASTHAGEEELIAGIFAGLRHQHPELRLILAPRHAERSHQVRTACARAGVPTMLRTHLAQPAATPCDAIVLNTTGELAAVCSKAHITFVGKSLRSSGGQNFIEAARAGCAVIVGPNMQNFRNLVAEFLHHKAILQVPNDSGLAAAVKELVEDDQKRRDLGQRAAAFFRSRLGAGRRTAEAVAEGLERITALPAKLTASAQPLTAASASPATGNS
jgi:3-deoxy-D-manno-octulosonic-acid transferase